MIRNEPKFCMKHIFSTHLLFFLVQHFNSLHVKDFFISLFDPTDYSLSISKELRENLYKYSNQTGLIVYIAQYLLNPLCEHNVSQYDRDYYYESKLEIAKITQPYLYKQNFSFQMIKREFKFNKKDEIYRGVVDIDRITDFELKRDRKYIKSPRKKKITKN